MSTELQSWIQLLYSGAPNASRANQWLMEFALTPAAWEASLSLLDTSFSPDVRFFCANLLLTKVKSEWGKLSIDQRSQLPGLVSQKLQVILTQPEHLLAALRLCIVLGTIASYTGGEEAGGFLMQALQMAAASQQSDQGSLQCALQLLTSFAEEAEQLDRGRRQSAIGAAETHRSSVLSLVESVLTRQLHPPGGSPPFLPALSCLQAWLKMDPSGGSSTFVSPGQLRSSHPNLFATLLTQLSSDNAAVTEMSSEVAADLLGPGSADADRVSETAALEAAVQGLLSQKDRALLNTPLADYTAAAVARVAAAIADRNADFVSQHAQLALPLADLMLACTSARGRKVAESAMEYFVAINTVPVSERLVALQSEVFVRAIQAVFRHICFAPDFTSWDDEGDDDPDSFQDFREQVVSEFLDTVCCILGLSYVSSMISMLEGVSTWQVVEGCLFSLLAVTEPLKAKLNPRGPPTPPALEQQSATSSYLHRLFTLMCTPSHMSQHMGNSFVCETAARVIGTYSSWLSAPPAGTPPVPLEGVLRLLLGGMQQPQSRHHSAQSFRSVCGKCRDVLGPPGVLYPLMDAAMGVIAPLPAAGQVAVSVSMDAVDREAVVEGLAVVVAAAEGGAVVEAGLKLLNPFIMRANSITSSGGEVGNKLLGMLAGEVRLVAAAIRHMSFPPSSGGGALGHPAVRLLEGAWPMLNSLSQSPLCRHTPEVVEALCEVYERFLQSARASAKPVLRLLMTSMLEIFAASPHPIVLMTLGSVVTQFGEVVSEDEVGQLQDQALSTATSTTIQTLQASAGGFAEHGELVGALLSLAQRYVLFSRQLLVASPTLPHLFQAAVGALKLRDREPLAPALALLTSLLSAANKAGDEDAVAAMLAQRVQECMQQSCQEVMGGLAVGVTDTTPRSLWRQLAGVLYTLLTSQTFQPAASSMLQSALTSPDLPVLKTNVVKAEDCQRFCSLVLRRPPLPRGRFDALIADFASLSRGEASLDVLVAYEM